MTRGRGPPLWSGRLGSERAGTRLLDFRRAIAPHANAAPVKDFDTKFADLRRT